MSLLDDTKLEKFAAYAEKHGLYDLFQDLLSKMIVAMPSDPFQFMIDFLKKPSVPAVVVLGPPCSGVTFLGQKIAKALDAVYVSSGEVLQAAIQKQTSAGVQCKSFVEKGQLVPDVLVTSLVVARLKESDVAERGYVLEGFPRTKTQATAMIKQGFLPRNVFEFDVSDEFVVQRASDLRFDPVTSKLYHLKDDPPPKNVFIQKRLIKKESDSPQFAQHRLVLYRHELGNVQTFFKQTHQRFFMKHGIVGNEHLVLPQVLDAVGSFPKSKAPQFFKLLVLGLPGSGREMVAEMIEQKYNRIRVSPRLVLNELQAANDPKASEILAYGDIESVPADIMGPLLAKRLQQPDCKERGWVLHGFPNTKEEAQILQQLGIEPSRVCWLDCSPQVCKERIMDRRYNPVTGKRVQLDEIKDPMQREEAEQWPSRAAESSLNLVNMRVDKYNPLELKSFFKENTPKERGPLFSVHAEDKLENVLNRVEASLLRPIPAKIVPVEEK